MRNVFYVLFFVILILEIVFAFFWPVGLWSLVLVAPLSIIGFRDLMSKKHSIRRNFPVLGNMRYLLESIRPEIMQYFVETDTEGRPINRIYRSLIYQRSKKQTDTTPFGTQSDVYKSGYEWLAHSIYALNEHEVNHDPRVTIGGKDCKHPYSASILNISAMSYGSLSSHAISALNGGASLGRFYHNTGEGAISQFHLKHEGDLCWQIGTGYFGCRTPEGTFDIEKFRINAQKPTVKLIEIKISQGAKPGHGGILPAAKNTIEIAEIRGVEPHTTVSSPPGHSAFSNPAEFIQFIEKLREASGGKPIGFKLCIGRREEFKDFCKEMIKADVYPDFISVDGGEGGTGAAPVEFSNSLGMPMRDGLAFVHDTLVGYGIRNHVKVIATGKIMTGFHMIRAMALGADICGSARAMMLALGCIQALQCNSNTCPVGVATQNKMLVKGLDIEDKKQRVANFHDQTIKSFVDLLAAAGIADLNQIERKYINRRVSMSQVKTYEELYPSIENGSYV